ncbi:MAG: DNA adenine methylase, partial [Mycoplasma sp.]|nr:DNA adenine methylase [Mycoplasma sp.]
LKDFFNQIKDKTDDYYYHLLVLIIFGFNSQIRFNDNNLFNIPIGKQGYNKQRQLHLKKFSNSLKLKNIKTTNLDFEKLEKQILKNQKDRVFLYLDPPLFYFKCNL